MGRCVYKPSPDRDEYVIWSTVVDAPVSDVLTRDEAVRKFPGGEDSVARADETGASWQDWRERFWGTKQWIRELRVEDQWFEGHYRFEDLPEIMRAWESQDKYALNRLITPFEDEENDND